MARRLGGIIQIKVNGQSLEAKGNFTYNINRTKKESIVGADNFHGFKETPQPVFIEGMITDSQDLDVEAFQAISNATVVLLLANGPCCCYGKKIV